MPWIETPNVAQYEGSDWANFVRTVPNCTAAIAKRLALQDPSVSYFFFCREPMILTNGRSFSPGDAVFFNGTQKPWFGSAPQCDSYQRLCVTVGYVGATASDVSAASALTYNNKPALDVIIFTANLNLQSTGTPDGTWWMDPSAPGPTMLRANPDLKALLESDAVQAAQDKGIAVVLCGLNNHDTAGWSEFATDTDAGQFAAQCAHVLEQYGLDGIDIDDEYSAGQPIQDSLAMVSYFVRKAIGGASFSKALFTDVQYFSPKYNGTTLGENLTWGWTMSYWEPPQAQLAPYKGLMANEHLLCGFQAGQYQPTQVDITGMQAAGYAGVMVFQPAGDGVVLLDTLLSYWPRP